MRSCTALGCFLLALWSTASAVTVNARAASAAAGGPSFDCGKADSNSARLICEDTFLMALDLRLADAFGQRLAQESGQKRARLIAQQRAWLNGNEIACQPPDPRNASFAKTVEPRLCLSQRYLDRMAAIGASPVAPGETPNNIAEIHPRCVQQRDELGHARRSDAGVPLHPD